MILESLIGEVDAALRTLLPPTTRHSPRSVPQPAIDAQSSEKPLTLQEKRHVGGLMAVNHAGEVCAQALYRGQASTTDSALLKKELYVAADEEIDHLAWCEQRLNDVGRKPSYLNPVWYAGSFLLGAIAGKAGDKWGLGFIAETEHQVSKHLQNHIHQLPVSDLKTRAILTQMEMDERHHAEMAKDLGAVELPWVLRKGMGTVAKVMTCLSYYV